MIGFGVYEVWSVSRLKEPDGLDMVRVTLKRDGASDCLVDCDRSQAPAIGTEIVLGWVGM